MKRDKRDEGIKYILTEDADSTVAPLSYDATLVTIILVLFPHTSLQIWQA